ncbi:siroheme decarboxylase AhbA [Natrialba magadii ATCC 43099]|uniref:siroheme decarboxylase n=1 Tax=Natrialba magadii (strain ATCC 43099 / DSM 3394 / CCM 3739 / CIP 104546 / IAM 13178 / JCM 8861 / NBRC 102185 / NCIMB 2190 / MS3) TaxID=547559 RepID=D3T0G8_NATMM|nr:Lrp/AsnC family transcriptional regulator [Natrialba magadii]ADD06447.1 siroheme decarboxylase AhbA [Natrialba magadii ATCC 43099]ELY31666.1 AsnC family transcriptional regulator [Natrialba magadii ATCC 43099]
MTTSAGTWRDAIDDVDAALIDGYQSGFPIEERPFQRVATDLGIEEDAAVDRVQALMDAGIVRRFGAVLNPPVIGSSTLAAVKAPEDRFDEVAETINDYRQVNHNYARDHEWNMWFVVTAGSQATRDAILTEIEEKTGCTVLTLPMLTDYYIDLEFPVVNTDRFARESLTAQTDASATRISESATGSLSVLESELLLAIQDGFPLSATPYRDVADELDAEVEAVLAAIERLHGNGCIKRIGCIINHVVTGFDSNCMVVWDVPDEKLDEWGERAGGLPYVTLCYHRPRRPEQDWPYNLFTMIHGRDSDAVDEKIDELAADYLPVDHDRLYSTETLKQTGARYDEIVSSADE